MFFFLFALYSSPCLPIFFFSSFIFLTSLLFFLLFLFYIPLLFFLLLLVIYSSSFSFSPFILLLLMLYSSSFSPFTLPSHSLFFLLMVLHSSPFSSFIFLLLSSPSIKIFLFMLGKILFFYLFFILFFLFFLPRLGRGLFRICPANDP